MAAFQSKWGFHPCDRETCKKLKEINKFLTKARHQKAAWERWDRKMPHNRVIRRKLRDSQGRAVGYAAPEPMPEPELDSVFCHKQTGPRHQWTKEEVTTVSLVYAEMENYYREARYPVHEEACSVFSQSTLRMIEEIYQMCLQAK